MLSSPYSGDVHYFQIVAAINRTAIDPLPIRKLISISCCVCFSENIFILGYPPNPSKLLNLNIVPDAMVIIYIYCPHLSREKEKKMKKNAQIPANIHGYAQISHSHPGQSLQISERCRTIRGCVII
jgi:hypothetical protein